MVKQLHDIEQDNSFSQKRNHKHYEKQSLDIMQIPFTVYNQITVGRNMPHNQDLEQEYKNHTW